MYEEIKNTSNIYLVKVGSTHLNCIYNTVIRKLCCQYNIEIFLITGNQM